MTNVGKIYKPELRAMAARRVAEAMVDEACAALGIAAAARPQVQADGDNALKVLIDAAAAGAAGREPAAAIARMRWDGCRSRRR